MLLLVTAPNLPELAPCDRPLVPALQALGLAPQVVVKPAVSASAYGTVRTREPLVAEGEVLVQPYLPAVSPRCS